MKIALDTQLTNPDGSPATETIRENNVGVEKPVTLRYVLMNAMLSQVNGDGSQVMGEDKIRRYDLWLRLKKAVPKGTMTEGEHPEDIGTEFEPEDVAFLRKAVLIFPVLVVGQVRELLT